MLLWLTVRMISQEPGTIPGTLTLEEGFLIERLGCRVLDWVMMLIK